MKQLFLTILIIGLANAEIDLSSAPDIDLESHLTALKERCDKRGGNGTFDKIKKASEEVVPCVKNLVNFDHIKDEINEAKKTGSMDEVFGKYCNKRPEIKACIQKLLEAGKPCMEDVEKSALNTTLDILGQLGDFVCYRDGDRIAMFIAEGGVECLKSRVEGIKNCVNSTLKINTENVSINSLPSLTIDKKKCDSLKAIQTCVVADLEKCKDTTPANIVDALFKFVKKNACTDVKKRSIFRRDLETISQLGAPHAEVRSLLLRKIREACDQYGPAHAFDNLENELNATTICLKNVSFAPLKPDITSWEKCYEKTALKFKECLPENAKYFPDFTMAQTKALLEFLKNNQGMFAANPENAVYYQCASALRHSDADGVMKECFLNSTGEIYNFPPKDVLCDKLNVMYNCAAKQVKKTCVPDIKLDKFLQGLHKAVTVGC